MAIYSVKITDRLLGVAFASIADEQKEENIVSHVIENSLGATLGISKGDILLYINNQPTHKIMQSKEYSSRNIQYVFYHQNLPFTATLMKSDANFKIDIDNAIYISRMDTGRTDTQETEIESTEEDSNYSQSLDVYTPHIALDTPQKFPRTSIIKRPSQPSIMEEPESTTYDIDEKDIKFEDEPIDLQNVSELISKYITETTDSEDKFFDSIVYLKDKVCLLSSNGLNSGYYEWMVKIVKCDIYTVEIGVVSVNSSEMHNMKVKLNNNKLIKTNDLGARALYGNEIYTQSLYYGSYNGNGKERCYRDLNNNKKQITNWNTGDTIKVCLDFNKSKINFLLNNNNVRKAMSLETKDNKYYPIIAFSGDSLYELLSVESKKWI